MFDRSTFWIILDTYLDDVSIDFDEVFKRLAGIRAKDLSSVLFLKMSRMCLCFFFVLRFFFFFIFCLN